MIWWGKLRFAPFLIIYIKSDRRTFGVSPILFRKIFFICIRIFFS